MPVALKLSKRFYDTIGQEVANEFVDALNAVDTSYRAEFRDLFAAHFGQLRAELDKMAAALRAEMTKVGADLRAEMAKGDSEIRAELRAEIARLDAGMARLATAEDVRRLDLRLTQQDGLIATFQEKLTGDLKAMKSELIGWIVGLWVVTAAVAIITRAVTGL